ncbi:hypothetical protein ABMA28_009988 [Loxostege sticticalis]|uniref:N-acetyltransferase domain-containing protein n=1 Tax=Loxostege sticticalis TaxID=481309 RepID=A0ABD0SC36_LOXSC
MCDCEIVVRRARSADEGARSELVRLGFATHRKDAFLLFFFQELTLQICVLAGAVLFIFCGVSVAGCAMLLPATAAGVALAVHVAHLAAADKQVQNMRKEMMGFVAELRGPLFINPEKVSPPIVVETELEQTKPSKSVHSQVVGSVSVSEFWGPRRSGWLHALVVHPQWSRRGIGRALVAAAKTQSVRDGLESLECVASELQPNARALLHSAGWEVRGAYHRRLCGAALTLLLAHLGTDLPHA